MASIELKNITKQFGESKALSGIDLEVADGTFCVLLGPSGCGKSTLLNIVAGLIPQDGGTVLMDGEPIDHLSPRQRDVAMVFQNYALYPHMTVAENLGFGLRMRKVNKDAISKQVMETAALLGIENLLNRKPRELSGGQQQRVAMGRALVRRPKLFLLDEPLSNLDARLRAAVRLELKQLHHQIKGTILYVTHDQVEAMTLGDKVVVMQSGTIRQTDSPPDIYTRPADTFVARFIGSPEMNLFPGEIHLKEGTSIFVGAGFSLDVTAAVKHLEPGTVELGVRPEDVRVADSYGVVFKAEVEMMSHIGSEKYVYSRLGREMITFRVDKNTFFHPGDILTLSIDASHLHFFRSGCRI
jgi:multiple sugar transport system ATP-binding protein